MRKFDTIYRECKKYENFANTQDGCQLVNIFFAEIEKDLDMEYEKFQYLLLCYRYNADIRFIESGSKRKFLKSLYATLNNNNN